jgi:tripartite-type tricarboxylate transporter receptor subunit TctC
MPERKKLRRLQAACPVCRDGQQCASKDLPGSGLNIFPTLAAPFGSRLAEANTMPTRTNVLCAALVVCGVHWSAGVAAQPIAEFYRGKTVTIVISSAPGGGYDTLARTVANYLGRHIPGTPGVVVRNMPGAGGIVATNHLYNVAPKDGTTVGGVQNNTPFEPLFGTKAAAYDPLKFNWLGTPSIEVAMAAVWHTAPVKTWQDAKVREITMGSSGVNSTPSFYGRLLNETLGLKQKIIVGYESQTQAFLAMERGEIDGYPSVFYSALMSTRPTWYKDKLIRILVQMGLEREPALTDVPFALDLVSNDDDKLLLVAAFAPLQTGRPYLLPPGVPADRVAAIEQAFAETFNDPAFVDEANKRGLGVTSPRRGHELQALLERVYTKTPDRIIERLRKISAP